jgi:exopolyphosphatase/pppGpp-phosphohydrolase
VLSVEEEASLLIGGAASLVEGRPGMVFDLGGGSLEMVYFGSNGSWLRDHLPLGALRIFRLASLASGEWDEEPARKWIEKCLQNALVFQLAAIHGTGGTVKAIAQVAGAGSVTLEEVRRIEARTRRDGAPRELSHRRRDIFLPGLMVVRRLLEHLGAGTLHYTRVDLGGVLLSRLRPFRGALRGPSGRSFLLQELDVFRS